MVIQSRTFRRAHLAGCDLFSHLAPDDDPAKVAAMFHYPIPTRPPIYPKSPAWVWAAGLFTDQELDSITTLAERLPAKQVKVGKNLEYKPDSNRSLTRWLPPSGDTAWIYQKITTAVAMLNATHYRFDISGLDEPLYYVTYLSDDQGHYTWHADLGHENEPTRKLSITFQMSDPANYDGGDLEINATGRPEIAPRERGKLILFPSYELHRVTPVTRGTRSALVAWIGGPPFR
jgi:PKHD-type hydroxylase